jgi:hypothetical protein
VVANGGDHDCDFGAHLAGSGAKFLFVVSLAAAADVAVAVHGVLYELLGLRAERPAE